MDPIGNFVPDYIKELKDEEVRQPILKLGKLITDRKEVKLGKHKLTKEDPEYWGLNVLVPTDEMAELCLSLGGIRKPKTFDEIVKIVGKDPAHVQEMLDTLSWNGVLEWNYENDKHEKQWVLPMYVPGSAEFSNMNEGILKEHPEMGHFFERMSRLPLEGLTHMVPMGGAGIGMHVIPVEKAIDMNQGAINLEKISYWLDKYEGKYAASPCSCRLSRSTFNEACGDDPHDWCIGVGDMADYLVETGKGAHYVTKEEALEIFRKAEENGFVHQITNIDGEDKIFAICNCNVNVCYALRTSQLFNTPNMSASAYVARVTKENCVACGQCVENCPAGAVKLGQKLCKADKTEVKYPRIPIPSEVKWGEHMWEEDYRNVNRINCYETGTAPCKTACPAHIGIQGYLRMAAQGRYDDALALIKKDNPLPAICGRICNRRCEDACTRGTIDQPIAIDEVKRFIAERDLNAATRYIPKKVIPAVNNEFSEKVAIIGAGPAGLSCAYYLALKGYRPVIFEKNEKAGGMLRYGIPSFKLEKSVIDAEIDVIKALGVEIKTGVEVGKDITIPELRKQGYKAFYIAIGCQGGRRAGVPGDDAEGVMTAVDFLREIGAKEDFNIEGDVVVIGGGNVAIDVSRNAIRVAKGHKVTQFCLESRDIMPASNEEIEDAEADGVTINCGWGPKEVLVENGKVKGIVMKKCLRVFDENKKFSPQYDENDTVTLECKHVFLSIGQAIVWGDLLKDSKVELGRGNGAVADSLTYQTAEPDIFVGGDVYTGPKFAIDAIAAGREGAISIHRFVQPNTSLTIGRNRRDFVQLDKEDIYVESYDNSSRQVPASTRAEKDSFRDTSVCFTEEQVKTETARCLKCGASVVDENKCIGCGVCTTKCEFDAIKLYRDNPERSVMRKSEDKLKYVLPNGLKQAIKVKFGGKVTKERKAEIKAFVDKRK